MTQAEQIAFQNGYLLGRASKGLFKIVEPTDNFYRKESVLGVKTTLLVDPLKFEGEVTISERVQYGDW